jgi:hypothetical protein
MQTVYIKFQTEADRARGFLELAKHSRLAGLPNQIYQVPREALDILEKAHINYRRATDEEVRISHDQVRNPSAAVL